jgi:hypothetical protein
LVAGRKARVVVEDSTVALLDGSDGISAGLFMEFFTAGARKDAGR